MEEANMELDKAMLVEIFKKRTAGERLPLLTLSEFFSNNTEEESIAPNQWGFGRPTLIEIWEHLRKVEERDDVAWVRVVLHPDTEVGEHDGEMVYELAGDSIAICTTARPSDIELTANCEYLCSDGVTSSFEPKWYTEIPTTPEGYQILSLWWD